MRPLEARLERAPDRCASPDVLGKSGETESGMCAEDHVGVGVRPEGGQGTGGLRGHHVRHLVCLFRLAPATKADALSMLDGIQAAEMLKGVRGGDAVNRDALADLIVGVSELVSDFPEISEMDLNPVFATKEGAIAADVRIVVDFAPVPPRPRPKHKDIVRQMNRIMKPKAVAVIGASAENGKIGNSVMKNLINGGYKGKIYPVHPKADEIMGMKAYKSVKDVPGDIDVKPTVEAAPHQP